MDFDDMLDELGEMGKFQITTYILICLPVLFAAANSVTYVFTAGVPNYRCYVPSCDNSTNPRYNEDWMEYAIPKDKSGDVDYKPEHCLMYEPKNITDFECNQNDFTSNTLICNKWVFDTERTIVNDWNITCLDNQWKLSLVGTCHFVGIVVGSFIFGILADKFGRKNVFLICIAIMSISGAAQALSPNYVTFAAMEFVNAIGTAGVYPLAFVLGVEMVGKKKRELTGIVLNYFYAIGEALVALVAWQSEDWVIIQLTVSIPCIVFISYYWMVPESVRWLLAQNKQARAKTVVCRVAKINKVELSDLLMESFNGAKPIDKSKEDEILEEISNWRVLKLMSKSRILVIRFVIIFLIWAVNAFVFSGLSLISTSMSGNKYVTFALVCLIEIPGYTIAWISMDRFGRKPSLIGSLVVCALTCGLSLVVPSHINWATITLFLLGKLGITWSFGVVYVYTAEMLPTSIRSGGVGMASTCARFGALLAPFVPLLGVYISFLPMLLFAIVAIFAALIAIKLPETLGNKLPETVEEAEKIGRK